MFFVRWWFQSALLKCVQITDTDTRHFCENQQGEITTDLENLRRRVLMTGSEQTNIETSAYVCSQRLKNDCLI